MDDQVTLTTKEAAELLKAHPETIRRLARTGKLPALKLGKDYRFDRETLIRWAKEHLRRRNVPRVLAIDDEEDMRKLIARFLELEGFEARTASDGEEGLTVLEQEDVNLIILDLHMPGMNGPEFLRRLREKDQSLPVLIVTGYPDGDLMAEALQYGPFMLLAKPIERESFFQAVNTVLNDNQSRGVNP